jgi:hypothetical protein
MLVVINQLLVTGKIKPALGIAEAQHIMLQLFFLKWLRVPV